MILQWRVTKRFIDPKCSPGVDERLMGIWIYWIRLRGLLGSNHMRRRADHQQGGSAVVRKIQYLLRNQSKDFLLGYTTHWLDGLTTTDRQKLFVSTSNFKLKQINYQKIGDGNLSEEVEI